MSDEEKNKRNEYQRNRYRNMTEAQTTKKENTQEIGTIP